MPYNFCLQSTKTKWECTGMQQLIQVFIKIVYVFVVQFESGRLLWGRIVLDWIKEKKIKYLTKQCYIWQFHKDTDYYYISLIWGCFLVMKKIMLKVIFLSSGFFFLIFQSLSLIRKHLVISTPTYLDLRFCWWKIHAQDIVQYNNQRHTCIALN